MNQTLTPESLPSPLSTTSSPLPHPHHVTTSSPPTSLVSSYPTPQLLTPIFVVPRDPPSSCTYPNPNPNPNPGRSTRPSHRTSHSTFRIPSHTGSAASSYDARDDKERTADQDLEIITATAAEQQGGGVPTGRRQQLLPQLPPQPQSQQARTVTLPPVTSAADGPGPGPGPGRGPGHSTTTTTSSSSSSLRRR